MVVKLFEALERPLRGEDNYDKPYDLALEQTAAQLMVIQGFYLQLLCQLCPHHNLSVCWVDNS